MNLTERKWSDGKLDKELCFAAAANDGSPECEEWLRRLEAEAARRQQASALTAT